MPRDVYTAIVRQHSTIKLPTAEDLSPDVHHGGYDACLACVKPWFTAQHHTNLQWCHMTVFPALRSQRQKDLEIKIILLSYTISLRPARAT